MQGPRVESLEYDDLIESLPFPDIDLRAYIRNAINPLNDSDLYEGHSELVELYTNLDRNLQVFWPSDIMRLPGLEPYQDRAARLRSDFSDTLFRGDKMCQILTDEGFSQIIHSHWPNANGKWRNLIKNRAFLKEAIGYWEENYGRAQMQYRKEILFAVMVLRERLLLINMDQKTLDRRRSTTPRRERKRQPGLAGRIIGYLAKRFSLSDSVDQTNQKTEVVDAEEGVLKNTPQSLNLANWAAGTAHLVRLSVENVIVKSREIEGKIMTFKREYSEELEGLGELIDSNDFRTAIGFRLALYPYNFNHYGIIPGRILPNDKQYDPFNEERLEQNAIQSALDLVAEIKMQKDPATYLAEQNTIEALGRVRMKILLPSLKLAQKRGRIPWPEGGMRDEFLDRYLIQSNIVLGEMGITIRRGGQHLEGQLESELDLFQRVLKERYGDDQKFMDDRIKYFKKHVSSPDSFIVSVRSNPLHSASLVLISKIDNHPVTYSVEPLYVEKSHRQNYRLGIICQNIALSLIEGLGGGRVVSTVYTNNSAMVRHLKSGAVGTTIAHDDKVLGLQVYEASDLKPTKLNVRAENNTEFISICKTHLSPNGPYVLTDVKPDDLNFDLPPFPCQLTFQEPKIKPGEEFYNPDLYQAA